MGDMPISAVDVAIIGAGAAGLMCGIQAGKRGRRVLIVEHNARIGRKILISGGGRCNFTNIHTGPENFLSANPHFAKSAVARYGPRDFLALVERHGFRYHEKTLGQLFCDGSAAEIVSMLEQECAAAGVRIAPSCEVRGIARNDGPGYCLETTHGTVHASSLVIASGGLSVPKIGASPLGYDVARQFGLQIVDCRPALVPLTFSAGDRSHFQDLAGVSADCTAEAGGRCFRERLLFTHRGLSGPAILQASSYWRPGERVNIDLAPGVDVAALFRAARTAADRVEARTPAARFLPKRLADRWFETLGISHPVAALSDREIQAIADSLHRWAFAPAGTEGYGKAEVTAGGVDTAELSSKTFEARRVPGLFFIGEVVDVTGQLGGFNFQWAWASGYSAGQFV